MQRTPFVLSRKYKIHAYSYKYRYLSIKHIIFATLSLNSFWCCFRASKRLFLGCETEELLAIRGVFVFFRTPQLLYSTPRPLSRLSVHSRASFTVSFPSQAFTGLSGFSCGFEMVFVPENALPNTVKPPPRCEFDFFVRVAALKFARNVVYATHARFRASFAVWFRAHGFPPKTLNLVYFGAKTR